MQQADTGTASVAAPSSSVVPTTTAGNPFDDARAEQVMKTLKYEEVYLNEYENLEEA
ncbi:hypothetical protein [Candidatus Cyanaurora vandensis]|uniref:hypothetical protein n=1 Tax=Candidatus Cyanaurora vandensis TaxID=2714958 RepID=UPI00257D81B5|nr:hypothetical protein [Candidatus Cyanaurora vandensis]